MKISFKLETLGYMVAEFSVDNQLLRVGHSDDYGDKFQTLLNKFFFIYHEMRSINSLYFPYSFDVLWEDDCINYEWSVNINSLAAGFNIKVCELSPTDKEYNHLLFEHTISVFDLFDQLYVSLHEMFLNFGFIGYKKNWAVGNFPITEYLILRANKKQLDISTIDRFYDDNSWKQKLDLDFELEILK